MKFLFRLKLFIVSLIVILFLSWLQITQPLVFPSSSNKFPLPSSSKLKDYVKSISKDYFPRDYNSPDNLEKLAYFIKDEFSNSTRNVELQTYKINGTNYHNVIATFGPENSDKIIVGAHYDTADKLPGADDNASGVAGLLVLANLLKDVELSTQVELVAFTLEEPPFFRTADMGSARYVKFLQSNKTSVRMMFCLEMIGYFNDEEDSQNYLVTPMKLIYPDKGNFITIVAELFDGKNVRAIKTAMKSANSLPVASINAPSFIPGLDFSDHLNFWNAGYPAVMITDTAFFRNDEYHLAGDTYDRLDYKRMSKVIQGVYASILELNS